MYYRADLILGEAFYMFIFWSFISQILNFLYWLVFRLNPTQFTRTPITVCGTLLACQVYQALAWWPLKRDEINGRNIIRTAKGCRLRYLGLILHSLLNYFGSLITGRWIGGSRLIGGRWRFNFNLFRGTFWSFFLFCIPSLGFRTVWRIMEISERVIRLGLRPRRITPLSMEWKQIAWPISGTSAKYEGFGAMKTLGWHTRVALDLGGSVHLL